MTPAVVILGGGFAGVKCARTLRRLLPRDHQVVLVNRDNHMVFQPLLPDVAGSSLNPRAIAPPLRRLLPGVQCQTGEVVDIDLQARQIGLLSPDRSKRHLSFEHLVLACGCDIDLSRVPGMSSHALGLKTIGDALALRSRVMQQLEIADASADLSKRQRALSFVVVGGGFSGVEIAGELHDLLESALDAFPGLSKSDVTVTLLHSGQRLLPELSESLGRFAERKMSARQIVIRTNARASEVTAKGVRLANGDWVFGDTVVCTIGTTMTQLIQKLPIAKDGARLRTNPDMSLEGLTNVWAVGDCAAIINAATRAIAPATAQFAERQGCQAAKNIVRRLKGQPTLPFSFKPVGAACGIGDRQGVAELFGVRISGFPAWWLWRSVFLAKIPSLQQKIKLGIDWFWELVFPRDMSHFRTATTTPVARMHFSQGEVVLTPGSDPGFLYAVESGRAEIVQRCPVSHRETTLLTLGPGQLFGSETLQDLVNPHAEIRAGIALDIISVPQNILSRMSTTLEPLTKAIQGAVAAPPGHVLRGHPNTLLKLDGQSALSLARTHPLACVEAQTPVQQALRTALVERINVLPLTQAGRWLGMVSRESLLRALSLGIDPGTPLTEAGIALVTESVDPNEDAARAAQRMIDSGLQYLPLVDSDGRVVGVLTTEDLLFAQ